MYLCSGGRSWGLGCSWGRRQPGEGRGAGDRDGRTAEPAGAELQSAAKLRCLRGQPWGPELLSLQFWQKKSQRDRQLPAPDMNLTPHPSSLPSSFSLESFGSGGGRFLLCRLCGTFPGLEATSEEAMSS